LLTEYTIGKKAKDLLLARILLQRGLKETVWLEFPCAELAHAVREGAWGS